MRRDIVNFLFDNLAQLQAYDAVKVYYDNGQHSIAESLHRAIEYALSKDAVIYRSAQPSEYRLSQAADYICTRTSPCIKYAEHAATATDEKFFGKGPILQEGHTEGDAQEARLTKRRQCRARCGISSRRAAAIGYAHVRSEPAPCRRLLP